MDAMLRLATFLTDEQTWWALTGSNR
jgi:hypothetical protein